MFFYSQDDYYCERVPLAALAQRRPGLCLFQPGHSDCRAYSEAFGDLPHTVLYSVKATLARRARLLAAGAGFGIVPAASYAVCCARAATPQKWFSPASARPRPKWNMLIDSIHSFNCELEAELALIDALAARLA
jgi:hypothetical protein